MDQIRNQRKILKIYLETYENKNTYIKTYQMQQKQFYEGISQ